MINKKVYLNTKRDVLDQVCDLNYEMNFLDDLNIEWNIITTLALQSLNHEIIAKKILFCLTGEIIEPYKLKNKRN